MQGGGDGVLGGPEREQGGCGDGVQGGTPGTAPQQRHHPPQPSLLSPKNASEKTGAAPKQGEPNTWSPPSSPQQLRGCFVPRPRLPPSLNSAVCPPRSLGLRRRVRGSPRWGRAGGGAGPGAEAGGPGRPHFPGRRSSCRDERAGRGRGAEVGLGSGGVPGRGIPGLGFPRRYPRCCVTQIQGFSRLLIFMVFF